MRRYPRRTLSQLSGGGPPASAASQPCTHPPSAPPSSDSPFPLQVVLLDPVVYPAALKVFAREICKNDLLNFGRLHFFFPDSRLSLDLSTDRTLKVGAGGNVASWVGWCCQPVGHSIRQLCAAPSRPCNNRRPLSPAHPLHPLHPTHAGGAL